MIHENLVSTYYVGLAEFKMMVDAAKVNTNFTGGILSLKIHPTQIILLFRDTPAKQSIFQFSHKEFQKLLSKFNRAANTLRLDYPIPEEESLHLENHTEVGTYLLNHLQPVLSSLFIHSENLTLQSRDLEEIKKEIGNITKTLSLLEKKLEEKLENITVSSHLTQSEVMPSLLAPTPIFIPSKVNVNLGGTVKTQTEQVDNTSINAALKALKKLKKEKK